MAYTALTVLEADIDGDELIGLMVGADTQGTSGFEFTNDGKTLLLAEETAVAGNTMTLEGVADKYGRSETTLTRALVQNKMYAYGPFDPALWNKTGGMVRFAFTTLVATTTVIAIRVANPQ